MAEKLAKHDYTCTLLTDVDKAGMDRGVEAFVDTIHPGDKVVFFFAGHGAQAKDEFVHGMGPAQYLCPLLPRGEDMNKRNCVALHDVQAKIAGRSPHVAFYIVDAYSFGITINRDSSRTTSRAARAGASL